MLHINLELPVRPVSTRYGLWVLPKDNQGAFRTSVIELADK